MHSNSWKAEDLGTRSVEVVFVVFVGPLQGCTLQDVVVVLMRPPSPIAGAQTGE